MKIGWRLCNIILIAALLAGCSGGGSVPGPQAIASAVVAPCGLPEQYTDLAISPNGTHLAYSLGPGSARGYLIASLNVMNGRQIRLTNGSNFDKLPAWSPDGAQIAFVAQPIENANIYVMNNDGSGERHLTTSTHINLDPVWSPDGKQIAFVSDSQSSSDIHVVRPDGTGEISLTSDAMDGAPAWSPDGREIAFESRRPDSPGVYLLDLASGLQTRLAATTSFTPITWSPDGRLIAYVAELNNNPAIYVVGRDGSKPVKLAPFNAMLNQLVWMPDGKSLLVEVRQSTGSDIYRVAVDPGGAGSGSGLTALTSQAGFNADPVISPDGKTIIFTSNRGGAFEIYRMDADGSHPARLTQNPANQQCLKWPF